MQGIHYQPLSELIEQYFQQNLDEVPNQKMVARAFEIHQTFIEAMQIDIQQGRLSVNQTQKPLKIEQRGENKDPSKVAQQTAKRLYEIKCKKDQMEKQLLLIQHQQEKVRSLQERESPNSKFNPNNKNYKSEMSEQDAQKLKALRMAYKKFEKDLEKKTKIYQENSRKLKHQQRQLQQKQLQQKCEQRKTQIQKNLELIAKRQQQRQKKIERQRQMMEQIKSKKKAFEEMQKKWKSIEQEQQKRKLELAEQRKKMQTMDYQSLKEHKKKYYQLIAKQKQERDKRMAQINNVFGSNSKQSQLFQSRLLNVVLDQQSKKKAEQEDKKRIARAFTQKKLQYGEIVRHNYKPKVDSKKVEQAIIDSKKQQEKNVRSYSSLQIIQKGNTYMKQASKNVSHVKVSNTVFSEDKTPFKYKDYLKEMGRTTKSGQYPPEMVQIKKLINDPSKSQYEKFQKAKMIAERLDAKKNRNLDSMVSNINAKIHILKEITE